MKPKLEDITSKLTNKLSIYGSEAVALGIIASGLSVAYNQYISEDKSYALITTAAILTIIGTCGSVVGYGVRNDKY